ncbi:hypothetical protein CIB48_g8776 [Xylaria polymorpha]|nr:hypothetical protein CIB48_g8776 [Xylaria polymorpha]
MRAVLPVWKTHSGHNLHFESQIPPAKILAKSIRQQHGFRLDRVDKNPFNCIPLPGTSTETPNETSALLPARPHDQDLAGHRYGGLAAPRETD